MEAGQTRLASMPCEVSGASTVCGIELATECVGEDHEIMRVHSIFEALDARLNWLVQCDAEVSEQIFKSLHAEWDQALSRAAALPARTVEGHRAKATMLLAAMRVVLGGPDQPDADLHETLAASLARDLTR
jgi:hypothetical protein